MRLRVSHTTKYKYSDPVAVCHNLVHLSPRNTARQSVASHRLAISPEPTDFVERVDALGNKVGYFSIPIAHRGLSLSAVSEVTVNAAPAPKESPSWQGVRESIRKRDDAAAADAFRYAFPSTHVPEVDALVAYATESFRAGAPIVDAAKDLTARVHADFEYDPTATTVSTPVHEVWERRRGVCQDFAHLQIAMLRSLGLAARYVSGYLRTIPPPGRERLVGADASHAWVSVYCGAAGWIDFDPTNDCIPGPDHVTLAIGRDYADVTPVQGVFVGGGTHTLEVSVDVAPLPE